MLHFIAPLFYEFLMAAVGFVGVHAGAGNHSQGSTKEYLKICHKACKEGTSVLRNGGNVLDAATAATIILEDCPITNAGLGSNLTWDGQVECDAMVMDGRSRHFGAVGAVMGVKNPVQFAKYLCTQQSKEDLSYGRIRPSIMVGPGALAMAVQAEIPTVPPQDLITPRSQRLYNRYKRRIERLERNSEQNEVVINVPLETVGVVCLDRDNNVAATCSSGGIMMKCSGRLGQAAAYGCGCWAENSHQDMEAVASSTTGCGEYLIRTMIGEKVARGVQGSETIITTHDIMKKMFLESPFLHDVTEKLAGVILLKSSPEEPGGEFLWCHTTSSMCVGSMSTADKRANVRMSRLPAGMEVGNKVVVEGIYF